MPSASRTIAVIGNGPAGALLGASLARRGHRVIIFGTARRPALVIGESLVPAIVPFLRELGIEDEVARYSTFKPGATWIFGGDVNTFRFADLRRAKTKYAYNTPRDQFDASMLNAARNAGAVIVEHHAELHAVGADRVRLTDDTLSVVHRAFQSDPDFIVDATGRRRTLARLLSLPAVYGDRNDTALFAHVRGAPVLVEGNVHIDRLSRGWAWRIPLPQRMSVGIVADSQYVRQFGTTSEEQFDNLLSSEVTFDPWGKRVERLTHVMKYSNYQVASSRGVGNGWALVGDAFGFVDPVFSSGLLISLDSAAALAHAICEGSLRALRRYEQHVINHISSWRRAVSYFYDGRLFTLLKVGKEARATLIGRLLDPHFQTHFPRVFTGEGTTNRYSLGLLSFMCEHGLGNRRPEELRIY